MFSDVKFAFRSLGKTPGFTAVVVLTLALAIGANTAIFSVLNAALFRPLPYPQPDRLVEFWSKAPDSALIPYVTGPQLKEWRERSTLCVGIAGMWDRFPTNLLEGKKAERINGCWVSANYLAILGVKPIIGRDFQSSEEIDGGNNSVAILSYETWQKRFGGDPAVLGRMLNFGGWSCAVIGVLPPHALANEKLEFLQPLVLGGMAWEMVPDNPWLNVIARLKPGVTPAQADAEANAISQDLYGRIMPTFRGKLKTYVLPMQAQLVADSRPALLTLLGAVGVVLLIACANVTNLLLVRNGARQKEMAVRIALGATAGRIVRLALIESVLLSSGGGLIGILGATVGIKALGFLTARMLPHMMQPAIDLPVLCFTLILSCGTGVIFGLLPARAACRTDLNRDLKGSTRGSTSGSRARTQSVFMVGEIALTVVLLIGAGLLFRSFLRVLSADFGFEPRHALICDLSLTMSAFYRDEDAPGTGRKMAFERMILFQRELVRQLEAQPGIESAGTVTTLPFAGEYWAAQVGLPGHTPEEDRRIPLDYVGGDYFQAMGMSLLKGRFLTGADNISDAAPVVVINETLARTLMPGENPLGRHLRVKQVDSLIVGVVNDVRHARLDAAAEGHVYGAQINNPVTVCLVVRARGEPAALIEDIRRTTARVNPEQSVSNFRSLEQAIDGSLRERRVTLYLFGIFAAVALGLACIGIYGVVAYTTSQRERELSIRMALGAAQSKVIGLVVREGLRLGAIGVGLGLAGGFAVAQIIASQLYAISFLDPAVFIAVPVFILLVVTASIYLPARRVARFDAVNALRAE